MINCFWRKCSVINWVSAADDSVDMVPDSEPGSEHDATQSAANVALTSPTEDNPNQSSCTPDRRLSRSIAEPQPRSQVCGLVCVFIELTSSFISYGISLLLLRKFLYLVDLVHVCFVFCLFVFNNCMLVNFFRNRRRLVSCLTRRRHSMSSRLTLVKSSGLKLHKIPGYLPGLFSWVYSAILGLLFDCALCAHQVSRRVLLYCCYYAILLLFFLTKVLYYPE